MLSERVDIVAYNRQWHSAILELHREAMAGFGDRTLPDSENNDLNRIEDVYDNGNGMFFVGLMEGKAVAMGGFQRLSADVVELKRMRIRTDFRRRGLGSQLLFHLEKQAVECGARIIQLETAKSRAGTLNFYEKHGYLRNGEGSYGLIAVVRYQKKLG